MSYQTFTPKLLVTPKMLEVFKSAIVKRLNVTCDDRMVAQLILDLQEGGFKLYKYDENEKCSNLD